MRPKGPRSSPLSPCVSSLATRSALLPPRKVNNQGCGPDQKPFDLNSASSFSNANASSCQLRSVMTAASRLSERRRLARTFRLSGAPAAVVNGGLELVAPAALAVGNDRALQLIEPVSCEHAALVRNKRSQIAVKQLKAAHPFRRSAPAAAWRG